MKVEVKEAATLTVEEVQVNTQPAKSHRPRDTVGIEIGDQEELGDDEYAKVLDTEEGVSPHKLIDLQLRDIEREQKAKEKERHMKIDKGLIIMSKAVMLNQQRTQMQSWFSI